MSAAAAAAAAAAVLPGVTRSPIGCTTEDPSPADFTKWCAERSVLWPKCGMAVSEATGRCVVATEDIKQGEVVVEVPDDAVLMGENSQIQELLAGMVLQLVVALRVYCSWAKACTVHCCSGRELVHKGVLVCWV
jgi:SET domain-containing protein 6